MVYLQRKGLYCQYWYPHISSFQLHSNPLFVHVLQQSTKCPYLGKYIKLKDLVLSTVCITWEKMMQGY